MGNQNYLALRDLQVYQLARQLSEQSWIVYKKLDWQTKKIIGDQFIRAIDSIGANIAEDYGRYHYLDKIKFYYNARASYYEAITHWFDLLHQRHLIEDNNYLTITKIANEFIPRFNKFINSSYDAKKNNK